MRNNAILVRVFMLAEVAVPGEESRERTIPTERLQLVGEVIANFSG
jgi:hypothetical protein